MSERNFSMRLKGTYKENTNAVARLEVEHKVDGQWQPLELGLASPGFDIFIYAMFNCQHMYFRVNCAERDLVLKTAEGSIDIGTDKARNMETLKVNFSAQLGSGQASAEDIDYIVSRMQQCPVSRNILAPPDTETIITLT